jgi:hypothetical protein
MKGIEKLCIENKNMALLYSIRDKIQNDFYYYTLIRKKYQDNIYKK